MPAKAKTLGKLLHSNLKLSHLEMVKYKWDKYVMIAYLKILFTIFIETIDLSSVTPIMPCILTIVTSNM